MNQRVLNSEWGWLAAILVLAAGLRFAIYADLSHGKIEFVGPCGFQFLNEIRHLYESRNVLNFDVFYYPPVPPMLIAGAAILVSSFAPDSFDLGRFCSCLNIVTSVGSLFILYLIGREWGHFVAIMAVAFSAVAMILVVATQNIQVYSTLFVLLAVFFFFKCLRDPSPGNLVAMGVSLGLGIASKYFPVLLFPMLLIVFFAAPPRPATDRGDTLSKVTLMERRTAGSLAWSGMLYLVAFVTIGGVYLGIFHREAVLGVFQAYYDQHPHEHSFEYHLPSISRLFRFGLVGLGGLAVVSLLGIILPLIKGISPWEWSKRFYDRHRLWVLPTVSMAGTVAITLGIPAMLNLNNYLKYTVWIFKSYGSSDGGRFPAAAPASSYLWSFFPENLGIPLFVLSCAGILYSIWSRDRKGVYLVAIFLPLYVMLEMSRVKVNRFAMELMPFLCLFAGIFLARLWELKPAKLYKPVAIGVLCFVFTYSVSYTLAWVNFQRPGWDVRTEAAEWLKSHAPKGSQLGMKTTLWLSGTPNLLPDQELFEEYHVTGFDQQPRYVLLPNLLYDVMILYSSLTENGYKYSPEDWSPQDPPSAQEVAVLLSIIHEKDYKLVKEFKMMPTLFNLSFGSQTFGGKTWYLEHTGPYGVRIYERRDREAIR